MEETGLWVGFALTLMVYSYLIRDNFLYRIAVYVFVGLAAGYIAIVTVESVITPWFDATVNKPNGDAVDIGLGFLPVLVLVLLALKNSSRLARLGNLGIAYIIGVGTAVALVGALTGTLFPLSVDVIDGGKGEVIDAVLIFIGVATSLVYFQYLGRRTPTGQVVRPRLVQLMAVIGEGFIVITLGALYAAAILTSLTIFSERISFVLTQIGG